MVEAMIGPAGGDVGRTPVLGTSEVGRVGLPGPWGSGASAAAGRLLSRAMELYLFNIL